MGKILQIGYRKMIIALGQKGKTMVELIEKQMALDALGDEPEVWTENDEYAQGLNNQWHYDVNALKALPSAQPEQYWETCFDCPLSQGCQKIKGCTNEQAIEYASQIPNDCPLSAQPEQSEPCELCSNLEKGDTLYQYSDWDGGIGFDYIWDIQYCPKCGRRLE